MNGPSDSLRLFFNQSEMHMLRVGIMLLSPLAAALVAKYKRYSEFYWALGVFFLPFLAGAAVSWATPRGFGTWEEVAVNIVLLCAGPLGVLGMAFLPAKAPEKAKPASSLVYSLLAMGLVVAVLLLFLFIYFPRQH